jgi:hypothetical protein
VKTACNSGNSGLVLLVLLLLLSRQGLPLQVISGAASAGPVEQPPQHPLLRRLQALMQHVGLLLLLLLGQQLGRQQWL